MGEKNLKFETRGVEEIQELSVRIIDRTGSIKTKLASVHGKTKQFNRSAGLSKLDRFFEEFNQLNEKRNLKIETRLKNKGKANEIFKEVDESLDYTIE